MHQEFGGDWTHVYIEKDTRWLAETDGLMVWASTPSGGSSQFGAQDKGHVLWLIRGHVAP